MLQPVQLMKESSQVMPLSSTEQNHSVHLAVLETIFYPGRENFKF